MKPDFLVTDKKESLKSWVFRSLMNWYPMYFGTGGKILFWAHDHSELHLRLRLNLWTYNYVGTIFGGSMFAASDPFYMLMLLRSLGPEYVVWDKSAAIRFRKPGRGALYAVLRVSDAEREQLKKEVQEKGETTREYVVQWVDKNGVVHAEITRQCYIASKMHYQKKKGKSQAARLTIKGVDL